MNRCANHARLVPFESITIEIRFVTNEEIKLKITIALIKLKL